ncbi:hypothetical protein EVJ18_07375 [Exiguobacterium sp. IPCH1]|nr:hypothetical protein EVJ19_07375 [Exiguobacterium sp. IPCI3]TCI79575.1 hypothetical protein EVJ18_07375 [Exiguobacterium sp. IPCH1]TCI82368.1 hypothetical protein EVJ17_07375 [Exiguobacterium sp. IPBC4]
MICLPSVSNVTKRHPHVSRGVPLLKRTCAPAGIKCCFRDECVQMYPIRALLTVDRQDDTSHTLLQAAYSRS